MGRCLASPAMAFWRLACGTSPFPTEFEDLLSRAGRRVLAGTHPLCGALANPRTRFLAQDDLLDRTKATRVRRALEESLADKLEAIEKPIPPDSIWDMRHDYGERLPKTSRARTIYFESRREPGVKAAEKLGLVRMMRSAELPRLRRGPGRPQAGVGLGPAGAALRAGRLCRAAQRPPSREQGRQGRLHRPASQPRLAGGGAPVAGLQPRRPFQRDRLGGQAGGGDGLPPAVLALHHAAGRSAKAARWVLLGTFLYR